MAGRASPTEEDEDDVEGTSLVTICRCTDSRGDHPGPGVVVSIQAGVLAVAARSALISNGVAAA